MVTYKFRCASCSASYIGLTSRHFKTRVLEHKGLSPRTLKPVSTPKYSSIREHCLDTGHQFCEDDFSILSTGKTRYELSILETLQIKKLSPKLNHSFSSTPLHLFDDAIQLRTPVVITSCLYQHVFHQVTHLYIYIDWIFIFLVLQIMGNVIPETFNKCFT